MPSCIWMDDGLWKPESDRHPARLLPPMGSILTLRETRDVVEWLGARKRCGAVLVVRRGGG